MCALSALISTSTYFPAFQCVCILIAWEKASFLFCPLKKKLWFLNCPPNFLGSMSYCITNYYDYSYTMINRDFLNLKNYKSRWTIRNKDECWKKKTTNWTKKKKLYRCHNQIDFNWILTTFLFILCISRAILCVMSVERNPTTLSFYSDRFLSEIF